VTTTPRETPTRRLPPAAPALLLLVLFGLLAGAPGLPAAAQEGGLETLLPGSGEAEEAPEAPSEVQPPPELPPVSELVLRALELAEASADDVRTIHALGDEVESLEPLVAEAEERTAELARRLEELLARDSLSDDHAATLAAEADRLASRIDSGLESASERVEELDEIRGAWLERRELWRRWRASLADDPEYREAYAGEISGALAHVDEVLAAANEEVPRLVDAQRRLRAEIAEVRRLRERALDLLGDWRESLFQRTTPVLFSAEHRERLRGDVWSKTADGLAELGADLATGRGSRLLEPRQRVILFLQVVLALALGWFARSRRPKVADDSRWAAVLGHPWAIGVLVAAGAGALFHGPLPPVDQLLIEAATAIATCRVAAGMFRNPFKRRAVYGVSTLYVLFAALDAMAVPVALLRLLLLALAALGAVGFALTARRTSSSAWTHQRGFRWLVRAGAVALAAVGIAEVLGYHVLAQWLLEASVATAFVAFVVSFLLRLARGALRALLRSERAHRSGFLSRAGSALAERLVFLVKLVLVAGAALYVAAIWDLVESPGQAWSRLVGAGFQVGDWEMTVGRLLTAVLAVYLAFAASWTLRALLDQAFFERRNLERGIKDSISTLLHYVVLVIGFFAALSIFGFDMTNLALVAGALSVGIGFGLQNVVNNFVSGLILLFERPVRVGDVVVVGDVWGTVEKIGLRSTVILTFNGSEMIVPNADLISEKVTNWTLTTPSVRLVMPIGVAYGNDPARVIEVLAEVAGEHPLSLADPPPMAIFTGFGESSLDFELRVWLGAFDHLLQARSELASALVRRFGKEEITIPFPQRDVWLRQVEDSSPAPPAARRE
jgi:potassium-dependent mechanosensitive channel